MEKVIYDYSKLRGRIKQVYKTETIFAEKLGISTVSLSSKLNNKTYFEQNQMLKAGTLLNIPKSELHDYFFCKST